MPARHISGTIEGVPSLAEPARRTARWVHGGIMLGDMKVSLSIRPRRTKAIEAAWPARADLYQQMLREAVPAAPAAEIDPGDQFGEVHRVIFNIEVEVFDLVPPIFIAMRPSRSGWTSSASCRGFNPIRCSRRSPCSIRSRPACAWFARRDQRRRPWVDIMARDARHPRRAAASARRHRRRQPRSLRGVSSSSRRWTRKTPSFQGKLRRSATRPACSVTPTARALDEDKARWWSSVESDPPDFQPLLSKAPIRWAREERRDRDPAR